MVVELILGFVIFVAGAVVGALAFRNNSDEGEALIASLKSKSERLDEELADAYREVEELKSRLTRKPKK